MVSNDNNSKGLYDVSFWGLYGMLMFKIWIIKGRDVNFY